MSFYAQIEGAIKYETENALQDALDVLAKGGWMDENHIWLGETGEEKYSHPNPTVTFETNTLRIPRAHYRNLARQENQLSNNAITATLIGSTIDGQFLGWVTTERSSWEVDLQDWARTQGHKVVTYEDGPEKQSRWQTEMINEWHATHSDYPRFN